MSAEKILFDYEVNVQEFIDANRKVIAGIGLTDEASKKLSKDIQDGFVKGSDAAKRFQIELKRQPKTIAEMELKLQNLKEILRDEAKIGTTAFKAITSEVKKTEQAIKGAAASAGRMQSETKKLGSGFGDLKGTLTQVAGAMGLVFGVEQVINFGKESVRAFLEAEQNAQLLLSALNGNAIAQKRLLDLSADLQKISIYSDDEIQMGQRFLAQQKRTTEQIEAVSKAAINLAAVKNIPLQTAFEMLDKTLSGSKGKLAQLIPEIKNLTAAQLEHGAAVELVAEKYKGAAVAAANTTKGRITQLKNEIGDMQEVFGEFLITSISPFVKIFEAFRENSLAENIFGGGFLNAFLEGTAIQANFLGESLGILTPRVDGASAAATRLAVAMEYAKKGQEGLNFVFEKARELYGVTREQFDKYAKTILANNEPLKDSEMTYQDLQEKIQELSDAQKELIPGSIEDIEITKQITHYKNLLAKATEKAKTAYQLLNEELAKLNNRILDVLAKGGIVNQKDVERAAELVKKLKDVNDQKDKLLREAGFVLNFDADAADAAIKELDDALLAGVPDVDVPITTTVDTSAVDAFWDKWRELSDKRRMEEQDALKNRQADEERYTQWLLEQEKIRAENALTIGMASLHAISQITASLVQMNNDQTQSQLNNLEKEKQVALSNKKLTAKERERIEKEYAAKERQIKKKQFEDNKAASIAQAIINIAMGVTQAFAQGGIAGFVTGALVAAAGAVEIAAISAQESPYFEGTPYLERKGAPRGKDTIRIRANEGEAIIPTQKNLERPGLAAAWINGDLDDFIMREYAAPMLAKQAEQYNVKLMQSIFSTNSMDFNDSKLRRDIREGNMITAKGFSELVDTFKRQKRTAL